MRQLIVAVLLLFALPAFGQTLVDYNLTTKYGWVGDEITFGWGHDGLSVTRFEVELTHFENKIVTPLQVAGTARSAKFTPTRAGHYTVRVRACNGTGTANCSPWHTSDERQFWVFVWLKPPSF